MVIELIPDGAQVLENMSQVRTELSCEIVKLGLDLRVHYRVWGGISLGIDYLPNLVVLCDRMLEGLDEVLAILVEFGNVLMGDGLDDLPLPLNHDRVIDLLCLNGVGRFVSRFRLLLPEAPDLP